MKILSGRIIRIALLASVASALTALAYVGLRKFLRDRAALLAGPVLPPRRAAQKTGPDVKTYTQKDLEELRKHGQHPAGPPTPYIPPTSQAANDEAVQRSLRTLEDINRINQLNQRLMDEQQRNQRR